VKPEPGAALVRIGVDVIQPARVERARTADDAMDFVVFTQEQFRQVGTILPRDAGD
jgi:hypothetical protein